MTITLNMYQTLAAAVAVFFLGGFLKGKIPLFRKYCIPAPVIGGVLFAKLLNLFLPEGKKLNPMIGAAGISAFPMSGRVVNKMGLAEDNQNFLLMYSISVNVSGQIASVIAGGLILTLLV